MPHDLVRSSLLCGFHDVLCQAEYVCSLPQPPGIGFHGGRAPSDSRLGSFLCTDSGMDSVKVHTQALFVIAFNFLQRPFDSRLHPTGDTHRLGTRLLRALRSYFSWGHITSLSGGDAFLSFFPECLPSVLFIVRWVLLFLLL